MDERLSGLEFYIKEKWGGVRSRVQSVRNAIPEGAIDNDEVRRIIKKAGCYLLRLSHYYGEDERN
jgi:hypothetical protein